ncbi:MAG TPA: MTAP family purine nucleoside phosphorylase [Solirubrobacterales bacterium]|nr:MTAP family purine nucleoside phosphorylase [Solirubrobacterales bacterium]
MGRLGVILGSNAVAPGGAQIVAAAESAGAVVVLRHGRDSYLLPHLIDHGANLRSLAESGCDRVLALGSVGSLRPEISVGSLVCPDDFIALGLQLTTLDDARAHTTPGFDGEWRSEVLAVWQGAAPQGAGAAPLRDGGVYWQTNGPRFETPAEVRLIAAHAHLVGMTLAAECVVASELDLRYAAVCMVDNMANGIGERPLGTEELERDRAANAARLREALAAVLPGLTR